MTLQEAKSIARHLGLTLRMVRSDEYRVNFRDGNETTAYYTDNLEDADSIGTEHALAPDAKRPGPFFAFVDPTLQIDPTFAHASNYSIEFSAGIENAATVPSPIAACPV